MFPLMAGRRDRGRRSVLKTPISITSVSPNIGDVSTANAGIVIHGTGFTYPNGTSIVQAVSFGASLATVTGVTATDITVTSPSLTIGTYDVTVTLTGGRTVTFAGGYDAWGWVAQGGWDILYLPGIGEVYDGDGKTISTADQSGHGRTLTWATRPLAATNDAGYGNQKAWNMSGGCYGDTATFSPALTQPRALYVVGNSTNDLLPHVFSDAPSGIRLYLGHYAKSGDSNQRKLDVFTGAEIFSVSSYPVTKHLYTVYYNTTNSSVYLDGAVVTMDGTNVGNGTYSAIRVGAHQNGTYCINGKIAVYAVGPFDINVMSKAHRYSVWKYETP